MKGLRQESVMAKHQIRKEYARRKRRGNDRAAIVEQIEDSDDD